MCFGAVLEELYPSLCYMSNISGQLLPIEDQTVFEVFVLLQLLLEEKKSWRREQTAENMARKQQDIHGKQLAEMYYLAKIWKELVIRGW